MSDHHDQLYEHKYIPKDVNQVVIYEHPHYFSDYIYNQKKILLHKGSMEYYRDYLKDRNFKVVYVTYDRKLKISNKDEGYYFDPIDKIDGLPKGFKMLESPNFLLNLEDYAQYRKHEVHLGIPFPSVPESSFDHRLRPLPRTFLQSVSLIRPGMRKMRHRDLCLSLSCV